MKATHVRYTAKPDAADENQRLIEGVFAQLHAQAPPGVRYMVLRLGETFVHVAQSGGAGLNPLTQLAAFKAFQSGVKERCAEMPAVSEATVVGHYRMLDE